MPRLKLPWKKKVELKFKWRNGEAGSIELEEYPESPSMKIREVLGVDNICEEFEYVRIYVDGKLRYTYPCSKRKKKEEEEDELDQMLKQMKVEIFKEYLEQLKASKSISAKDILAQMIAEFQMSRDLYNALKQLYEPHQVQAPSSSPLDRIMEKLLENIVMRAVGTSIAPQAPPPPQTPPQQAPQQVQQAPQQVNAEALLNLLPEDLKNTVKEAVEKFKQMSPEEQQKLIQEALKEAEKFRG